jgi:regulatory protein
VARRSSSPPAGTAQDAAVRYLAGRAHSRLELRRKLVRNGFDAGEVEAALDRLTELGYLDDAAFARALVRRRSAGRGPAALAAELTSKGIGRDGVAAALADFDPDSQLAAATRLAERLYADNPVPGYREMLDRIGAKLIRRGYSGSVVREACRTVLAAAGSGPEGTPTEADA